MKDVFDFKCRWYTWAAIVMLAIWLPFGLVMPDHWGWENGVIETTQMLMLIAGAYVSFLVAKSFPAGDRMRKFWYWTIPVWGLVFARELSFGRSFFPYLKTADGGREEIGFLGLWRLFSFSPPWPESPVYVSRDEMLIGDSIYGFVFLVAVVTVAALIRYFDWKNIRRVLKIPVFLTVIFILSFLIVPLVEHGTFTSLGDHQDTVEEFGESIYCLCLVFIVLANKASYELRTKS